MDINEKKIEIIQHIIFIHEPEVIKEIDRFIRNLDYEEDDRYYTRKRFNEDGTPKDKVEKKPNPINEARRKIKGMLNLYK